MTETLDAKPPPHRRSFLSRVVKWLRNSTLFVIAVALLYVLATNVLVRTRLLRNALGDPSDVKVDYTSAYSLYPGHVHVDGLTLLAFDSHVEWTLHIDRCEFDFALLPFLKKRFSASHVRGDGVEFRVRLKLDRVEHPAKMVAALPPIADFATPPLKNEGPPAPPLTDKEYNLWSVVLEDVDADHVREVWIQTVRMTGDLRIREPLWFFRPVRWLEVGPATIDLRKLDASYGDLPIATGVEGTVHATVHPFDVREPEGAEVLRNVSLNAVTGGQLLMGPGLDAMIDKPDVHVDRGGGPFHTNIDVRHGVIQPASHFDASVRDAAVRIKDAAIGANVALNAAVEGATDSVGTLGISVDHAHATVRSRAKVQVQSAVGSLKTRKLDLVDPFGDTDYSANVRGASTTTAPIWLTILSPESKFGIGNGTIAADADLEGSLEKKTVSKGKATVRAKAFSFVKDDAVVLGNVEATLHVHDASIPESRADLSGSAVAIESARATIDGIYFEAPRVEVLAGKMSVGKKTVSIASQMKAHALTVRGKKLLLKSAVDARISLKHPSSEVYDFSGTDLRLESTSFTTLTSGEPIPPLVVPEATLTLDHVILDDAGRRGTIRLRIPSATTPDLGGFSDLFPIPNVITLLGGTTRGRAALDINAATLAADGHIEVDTRALEMRIGNKSVKGDLTVRLKAVSTSGGSTAFSGSTLQFKEATAATPGARAWWGRLALTGALRVTPAFTAISQVHLTARDASPATEILSSEIGIPHWVSSMFEMEGLTAKGEVELGPETMSIRGFQVRGEGGSADMEFARRGKRSEGVVHVGLGILGANFALRDGSTRYILVPSSGWFESETARIRKLGPVIP